MNYRKFEIIAVVLTGLMKFVAIDYLEAKFWYILLAGTFWIVYISSRIYQQPSLLYQWGIRVGGFRQTVYVLSLPALLITIAFIWFGVSHQLLLFNWHIVPVMLLYPLWGTLQQLLIISLFGANIYNLENVRLGKWSIFGLTSVLFSVVHFPSIPLMIATFFLAITYCLIFFRFKNILVLGIFHGWLAAFFYFFALGKDPWLEFIGSI